MERIMIVGFSSQMSEKLSARYNQSTVVFEAMLHGNPLDLVLVAVDAQLVAANRTKVHLPMPFEVLVRHTMFNRGLMAVDRFIMIPIEQDIVPN